MTSQYAKVTDERADVELDCSGVLCPLPVYRASLALGQLSPGQVLKLITTDPGHWRTSRPWPGRPATSC